MTKIDGGGPAFPSPEQKRADGEVVVYAEPGMTLRDYFAAKVLVGTLSDPHGNQESSLRQIAEFCYELADHMLEVRNG